MKKFLLVVVFSLVFFLVIILLNYFIFQKNSDSNGDAGTQSPTPTPDTVWTIPVGTGSNFRAVHMGGDWGTTKSNLDAGSIPEGYFTYLRDLNVNWVGLTVTLHLNDSMDAELKRIYDGVTVPTMKDQDLISIIRTLKNHGFNVYVTLAIDDTDASKAAKPFLQLELGDPSAYQNDTRIKKENWPWDPQNKSYTTFVNQFWQSYTAQAVYYAKILEQEKVDMYSIGTETESLFRTRNGGVWKNNFGSQLRKLVAEVRQNYSGKLTYDMVHDAVESNEKYFKPVSDYLWQDLNLDVIGVSAYFHLADKNPDRVMSVTELDLAWQKIFDQDLKPLKARNPDKPIVFLEFGYDDAVIAPFSPINGYLTRVPVDADANKKDDGQEQQANIYQSFFDTLANNPGTVSGEFLWGMMMADQQQWDQAVATLREPSIRGKLAEQIVRNEYQKWREQP